MRSCSGFPVSISFAFLPLAASSCLSWLARLWHSPTTWSHISLASHAGCPSGARVPPVPGLCCPGSSVAAQGRELGIKGLPTLPLTVLAVGMVLSRWAFCPGGQQANVTTWCPQGAPQPRSCVTTAFRCSTESSQDLAVTRNHAP